MSITKSIEAMRKIVCMYDKIQTKKDKIRNKAGKALSVMKGGNKMKFGTIIGIVVGAITLIAAGAAAMYVFLNGFPCCKTAAAKTRIFMTSSRKKQATTTKSLRKRFLRRKQQNNFSG